MATVVFQRQAGDVVEWILELDRAKDVLEEWKQSGLAEAMAAERLSRGKMVGVSDESQEEADKAADAKYGLTEERIFRYIQDLVDLKVISAYRK